MRDEVVRVERCRLFAGDGRWAFAHERAAEIDRHWQRRTAENPGYFNGTIFVMERHTLDAGGLDGRLMPVEFKSFLYWKEHGYPDMCVRDAFGSALIRAADGAVLLGRQRPGNINAGLAYLPGGFIDPRDVDARGEIDIAASIAREVEEETGLAPGDVERQPGFILTFAGPMLSIAVEVRARLAADALAEHIRRRIGAEAESELEDVVVVRSARDLVGLAMPIYAEVLMREVFACE